VPEQADEADKLDDDARDGPLEEDEEAAVSADSFIGWPIARRRDSHDADTHMPPKKHTVPRHFSRRDKK
jgi:hypothetical protein